MKVYAVGQISFANRGCEALIRSEAKLFKQLRPDATIFCPSQNIALDRQQWPEAEACGIQFVPMPVYSTRLKIWSRINEKFPAIQTFGIPTLPLDDETEKAFAKSDAVIMTGGDNISLDYGIANLYYWVGLVEAANRMGKPTHLVAGSVGPFTKNPIVERYIIGHLNRYATISVRETASLAYLKQLGISDVKLVPDPAFVLDPQVWPVDDILQEGRQYVGINVSPLVRKFRTDETSRAAFDNDIVTFIHRIVEEFGFSVLLVPHVDPLAGKSDNSDRQYMFSLMEKLGETGGSVVMTPDRLNAAQIKYAIGKCRFFIGARTHATIGAFSQLVPTRAVFDRYESFGDSHRA